MSEPTVLYDEHDTIAVITLNRPDKLNALTNDLVQGVAAAIEQEGKQGWPPKSLKGPKRAETRFKFVPRNTKHS